MSKMLKPTILSLSLLTVISTSAISPALGEIADYFPSAETFLIQLIAVMHALAVVPSLFFASWLTVRFSKKRVLLAGLLVFALGGISGGLAENIYILLLSRIVLGIGLGMVIPFSTALIADFFEGEQKTRMMGLSSSFNMLGGMIALTISGQLAILSWKLPFLIYACGIPVLLLNAKYLPQVQSKKNKQNSSAIEPLPRRVYLVAFIMFLFCMMFFILTPTMALFLRDNAFGDARMAGTAISFASLGGFTSGFVLPWTRKLTGKFFLAAMLAVTSTGFLSLYLSGVVGMVFAGALCIGFANRSVYPLFFLKVTQGITPDQSVRATAVLSAMIYVGQFMAPPFQRLVGVVFHHPETRFLYLFVASVTITVAMALFLHAFFNKKEDLRYVSE